MELHGKNPVEKMSATRRKNQAARQGRWSPLKTDQRFRVLD
jgi:hypothetical protein